MEREIVEDLEKALTHRLETVDRQLREQEDPPIKQKHKIEQWIDDHVYAAFTLIFIVEWAVIAFFVWFFR